MDDRKVTIDTGDMGKLTFSGDGSSGPVGSWDDITPTANEEAHGGTVSGTVDGLQITIQAANNRFVYDYTINGWFSS